MWCATIRWPRWVPKPPTKLTSQTWPLGDPPVLITLLPTLGLACARACYPARSVTQRLPCGKCRSCFVLLSCFPGAGIVIDGREASALIVMQPLVRIMGSENCRDGEQVDGIRVRWWRTGCTRTGGVPLGPARCCVSTAAAQHHSSALLAR